MNLHREWFVTDEHPKPGPSDGMFWFYFVSIICILTWAATMAGLTVGLMSIDPLKLRIMERTGTQEEKNNIKKLQPLLKNHHYLLATIVTGNCFAMELLPLAMNKICSEKLSILLSVTLILIFGEILPQALCLAS